MLFKKQKYECCNAIYDPTIKTRPNCGKPNTRLGKLTLGSGYLSIPWVYQIICIAVGTFGLGIISTILSFIFVVFFNNGSSEMTVNQVGSLNFLSYAFLFAGLIVVIYLNRKIIFPHLGEKFWRYLVGIGLGAALILVTDLYGTLIQKAFPDLPLNENEETVENIVLVLPVLSVIFFGIIGPICEEFTYRVGIFSLLNRINRVLAYIGSALLFAFAHFGITGILNGDMNAFLVELINLPVYILSGLTLAFAYDKFGLSGSMSCHITNNVYCIIVILIQASRG